MTSPARSATLYRRRGEGAKTGYLVCLIVCLVTGACQLKRPTVTPTRMIEPQLLEAQLTDTAASTAGAATASPIRLLDTQARGHIGRPLLHQQPSGELIQDATWRWSSAPDRYLDTALHLELASAGLRLVDLASSPSLATTLMMWHVDAAGGPKLVGAAEFELTGTDRVVHLHMVRASEPISAELPGDVAAAAGRLLRRIAQEGLRRVAGAPGE